ncbi:ROK family protein [Lactiplantibacillus nangangensis]|uniref:ROK family protein n=1 Tax=Lactiplantibacillus nangangensis TaxID=2559917 RepID=A0ABW1SHB9_9LACO|nr:ROK family protein [Lactiplantibacillus nangangensis]
MAKYLVFDVGGTMIKYALMNHSGQLCEKHHVPTPTTSLTDFIATIQNIINRYQNQYVGVGVSIPGKVTHPDETIYGGGSLPFLDQQQLLSLLTLPSDVQLAVENDGKAAALAELWLGNLKDVQNGVALVLGTGVGSGLVLNGQLFMGTHFQAGEISLMLTKLQPTMTNLLGAQGSAVKMIEEIATKLQLPDRHDGLKVFAAINEGDERAVPIFTAYCQEIALTIHNLQSVLDVQRYVIGGGISAQPIVTKTIREAYHSLHQQLPIIQQTLTVPEIVTAKFSNDANLYGALYHLLQVIK